MGTVVAGRWQFGVLGPLEASCGGEPVRLGGERQRVLLALLLVRANELVTVEQLVEEMFGEGRHEGAANAVQVAVSRLRRVLAVGAGEDGVLQSRPGGYALQVEAGQLDAAVFERLLGDGRRLFSAGQAAEAAGRLREALGLWRGPAFADLAGVDCLQEEIRRLEELRLVAVVERIDAELALGGGADLVSELESLVASEPLHERLRGQLMLALYRAGRQADALAAYRAVSDLLRDQLGLEPSPELRDLERSILNHETALQPVAGALALHQRTEPTAAGAHTLMFSDVEGSTRLIRALGEATYREVLDRHFLLIRQAIDQHGGMEASRFGDALFAVFGDASAALCACAEAQRSLAREPWPESIRLSVRIGVHRGEVTRHGGSYQGVAVQQTARIAAKGHGGQVVVSDPVKDAAALAHSGLQLASLGNHLLEEFDRPVELHQLLGSGLRLDFPALRARIRQNDNLPFVAGPLIGRSAAMVEILELVAENRLVTLVGPGGVGKTRLALGVASQHVGRHRDGVWLAELAAAHPEDVEQIVADLLDVSHDPRTPLREAVAEHLADRTMLLVIDNAEHIADAVSAVLRAVLSRAPGVSILVTSRVPLHLEAERVVAVEPLSLPERPDFEGLLASGSGELFLARARAAGWAERISEASAVAIAEICRALDGLPLALEIAAAHARMLDLRDIAQIVERTPLALQSPARDLPPRHRSLEHTLAWSVEMLPAPERLLLERVTVFAEARELDEIVAVCAHPPLDEHVVINALAGLADHSLVKDYRDESGRARYGLLQTVRSFVVSRTQLDADHSKLAGRHRQWLTGLLHSGAGAPVPEVAAAVRCAVSAGDHESALRLTTDMSPTWLLSDVAQGLSLLRDVLGARHASDKLQADGLITQAQLEYMSGDSRAAERSTQEAIHIFWLLGDDAGLGRALSHGSRWAARLGDDATAKARATQALGLPLDAIGVDAEVQAKLTLERINEYPDPVGALRQIADRARQSPSPWMLFDTLRLLAERLLEQDRLDEASAVTDEAATVAALIARTHSDCMILCLRGSIALARHEIEAASLFDQALVLARTAGTQRLVVYALERRAATALLERDFDHAVRLLREAAREGERLAVESDPHDRLLVDSIHNAIHSAVGHSAVD
jgi:predicted ATPase/DNA-binding SARP family transcriptional activator